MATPIIQLSKVSVRRNGRTLVKDLEFSLAAREILTVVGPNGAGKSTLIKLLAGLISPTAGKLIRPPKLKVGYMPQRLRLDKSLPMTVDRFLRLTGAGKREREQVLPNLQIDHLAKQQMQKLSGGETQRVLLARAILRKPELLLLDEPLQGVDIAGQQELYRLIASLREALDCAVVMVSHDLHMVMAQTDSVICLNQHICCHGKPESVSQHPEYLRLLGDSPVDFAIYTHKHDHQHNLRGDVVGTADEKP